MNQPGNAARDDEPSRSSRGGSVVFVGRVFAQITPPIDGGAPTP